MGTSRRERDENDAQKPQGQQAGTATKSAPQKSPPKADQLPPWKVILHNDDVNDQLHVVETIIMLTSLGKTQAVRLMFEAHRTGQALLLTTHRERAELYQQQFASRKLLVTIEKA